VAERGRPENERASLQVAGWQSHLQNDLVAEFSDGVRQFYCWTPPKGVGTPPKGVNGTTPNGELTPPKQLPTTDRCGLRYH
jgi:hypothetical protein